MLDNPVSFVAMGYIWWHRPSSFKRVLANIEFVVEKKYGKDYKVFYVIDVQEAAEGENKYPTHITTFSIKAETNGEFYEEIIERLKYEGYSYYKLVESDLRKKFIDSCLDEMEKDDF